MNLCRRFLVCALLLGLSARFLVQPVHGASEDAPKALSGKTIRIIVGYSPGGGFDTLTRIVARHLSKHIPGKPNVIVNNMTGAGGAVALNYVYARGTPDGLTWVASDGALVLSKILGLPGPEFDVDKFPWLGVAQSDHQVCMVMTRTGITTAEQFLHSKTPIRIASTVPGDSVHIRPVIAAEAVSANFKLIQGYPGTADMRLAMQSGDADAACWGWESMKVTGADMLQRKEAIPILQIGVERHPDLPNVPNILDLPMSNDAKVMLRLVAGPGAIAKLFAVSPGTPQPVLDVLRKAFADALKDPELLADAEKSKMSISYTSAEQVTKIIKEMNSTSPELKQKVAKVARPG
ncbi:MAG TPA: tripartite tricarboxylate transporter substrate-binding protein [Candidatus Binatia bacterium]|nr:tripartite tricarboxylate transporter substrate-binding protein [Candidatus Binatia bacterium]